MSKNANEKNDAAMPGNTAETDEEMSRLLDENANFQDKDTDAGLPETDDDDEDDGAGAAPEPQTATPSKNAAKSKKNAMAEKLRAKKKEKSASTAGDSGSVNRQEQLPQYTNPPAYSRYVEGSNIGSKQNEPDWTAQQLAEIAAAKRTVVEGEQVNDTRRSAPDPEGKYVVIEADNSVKTRPAAYLPNIKPGDYKIGYGKGKADQKTGKSRIYCDIIMLGRDRSFVLNQWTIMNVVMEGVPQKILDKPARTGANGRPERRIGHDFARIGLPALSVGPIFETMGASMPGLLDDISVTRGYYWINASWGVTNNPGKFIYKGEDGQILNTTKLQEGMRRIMPSSSLGIATIAISVSDEMVMNGATPVASGQKNMFSIKLHNMFHLRKENYHSPPQASATGFEISDDMFASAEQLNAPTNTSTVFASTQSAFNPDTINPFALLQPQQQPGNTGTTTTGFL